MSMISVIMPVYNSLPYLKESYASVIAQTYADFEFIITDDGSTDGFDEWSATVDDDRVTILRQKNSGASAARNTGIQAATGKYIAFIDADDIWFPEKLEKQLDVLKHEPEYGLVYTHARSIDGRGRSREKEFRYNQEGWVWRDLLRENFLVCGSTPMIRKECFDRVGMFDTSLMNCNDRDMWIRLARHYQFTYVPEVLVEYRQYDSSLSMQYEQRERSINIFLTKAYHDPPPDIAKSELDSLMRMAFSQSYNVLAWKPLQSESMNWSDAYKYYAKSIKNNPQYVFSKESMRLAVSLLLIKIMGRKKYDVLRRRFRRILMAA